MKHYGDITQIHGWEVPLVDVVTGGSPCQDLSVAGKRAGLDGERSGLFMEQIRIIKEMRDESRRRLSVSGADFNIRDIKPRYMVWENVAGAFSSNGGEDFRAVLEETAKVAEGNASIPEFNGKWPYAGCIMGNGWSIAWRLHDAQFWGVPQRRKRIALVADFGGESAPEILFERKGVSGDIEPGREKREDVAAPSARNTDSTSYTLKIRGGVERDSGGRKAGKGPLIQTELSATLGVSQDQTLFCLEGNGSGKCRYGGGESYVMQGINGDVAGTLDSSYYKGCGERQGIEREVVCCGGGGYQAGYMLDKSVGSDLYNGTITGDKTCSLNTNINATGAGPTVICPQDDQVSSLDAHNAQSTGDKTNAILQGENDNHNVPCVYGLDRASFNQGKNAKYDFAVEEEIAQPIVARGPGGVLTP